MAPTAPRESSSKKYTPPSPPKIGTCRPPSARSRVILGGVGASSSFTACAASTSAMSRAMNAGGITTWVVTGSSCSTTGRRPAAATAW